MPYYRHFLYPKNREKSAGFWLSVQKRPVSRADEGIRPYEVIIPKLQAANRLASHRFNKHIIRKAVMLFYFGVVFIIP